MATTQQKLIQKYGDPTIERKTFEILNLQLWDIPLYYNTMIPALPNRLYCHKDLINPLAIVFEQLCSSGLYREIRTFDGCFNVRLIRGSKKALSIHSWALAIDLNAADNPLNYSKEKARSEGLKPFSDAFDEVFRSNGFTCGIDFNRKDGMHFEYTKPLIG